MHYESEKGERTVRVALGDAPNDVAMLEAADIGFIIPNPAHAGIGVLEGEAKGKIRRAAFAGPQGWNHAVLSCIDELMKDDGA